jgi:uncharacterized protein (DUF2336 family)
MRDELTEMARAAERKRDGTLLRAATELYVLDASHDLDEHRRFEDLALHFLPRVTPDDRRFVAEALAGHAGAPHAVVCLLARDLPEVARPVLQRSPILTAIDLLAIIATTGDQHHQAIARRASLAPEVKRALRLTGSQDILNALADSAAGEPAGFYYASTTRDPWRFLSLDRKGRLRLIAEIASGPRADRDLTADARADRAFRSILGAARIVGFARSGRFDAIIETVADGLGLPLDLVKAAVGDAGGEPFAIMLKALRLDEVQARQVLLLASPAGRDSRSFFPLSDLFAGMEPDVAEAMIAAWRDAATLRRPVHQPHFAENGERRRAVAPPAVGRSARADEEARRA